MHDDDIYVLTPAGEEELRGGKTTLSPSDLEVLVRVDGFLTVGQLKSGASPESRAAFDRTLDTLAALGWLQRRRNNPFEGQFNLPSSEALSLATAEADVAAASLQRSGYFVRIAQRGAPRTLGPGETLSAVIVEDEEHLAKFLQHYLGFEGFEVRRAGNRESALAELSKPTPPDLILLDVMLPDADGFEILAGLKRHPRLKQVPVIMMTAKATRESVIRGLAQGADGYVTKPFEAETLLGAVRTVLGLPDPGDAPTRARNF